MNPSVTDLGSDFGVPLDIADDGAIVGALMVGTGAEQLTAFTGFDPDFVRERVGRLQESGVFRGEEVAQHWDDPRPRRHDLLAGR
jgi:hypothetical protein